MERKYIFGDLSALDEEAINKVKAYISLLNVNRVDPEELIDAEMKKVGCFPKMDIGITVKNRWYYINKSRGEYYPRWIGTGKLSTEFVNSFRRYEALLFGQGILYPDKYSEISNLLGKATCIRRIHNMSEIPTLTKE